MLFPGDPKEESPHCLALGCHDIAMPTQKDIFN